MKSIEIKRITIDDIGPLQKVCIQTFMETFSSMNTEENMNHYLKKAFSFDILTSELSNENSAYYFAVLNNRVTGYLKLNVGQAQNELKEENTVEIERIYILNEFQGKRIGQFMLDFSISYARKIKADYIWLGVWENNLKAKKFYSKNGFVEFDQHIFKLGDDEQTDIMMKITL